MEQNSAPIECITLSAAPADPHCPPPVFSVTFTILPSPPPPPLPSAARGHLSPSFLLLTDLIAPPLISFDRCQLIRGQHLDGSHDNWQDQIFQALKGGSRSPDAMRNSLRLTAVMEGGEQRPEWHRIATVCVCVCVFNVCLRYLCVDVGCVCVASFPLSALPIQWTQWERVEWRAVCCCVYA